MWIKPVVLVAFLLSLFILSVNGDRTIGFSQGFAANAKNDVFVLGIFPRRNTKVTINLFQPLANYLSKKLGKRVVINTSRNFASFWKGVMENRYDLVHYNQYHYVISHEKSQYSVIAKNEEFGEDTIAGSILVRKDSGIKNIRDLKGKTISFGGGPKAMQSYITPLYYLRRAGIDEGDYGKYFAKNPPNAIMSVYFKQSDAAGSGDKVLDLPMVSEVIEKDELMFLVRGEQLPHLPWAVSPTVPDDLRFKIQTILTELNKSEEGKLVLERAKLTGINKAVDSEYDRHREIIDAVYH